MVTPICLFTYNRYKEIRQTVEALQRNFLASKSDLIIFSDGPRNKQDSLNVSKVRQYIRKITGFKSVEIIEFPTNKGLANSIISGVTRIIEQFDTVIVLEDDLVTSPNFLDFMNQALLFYQEKKRVLSISGYSFSINHSNDYQYDMELNYRASSWGWATWVDRWKQIDWEIRDYSSFKLNFVKRLQFNRGGSDMSHMLDKQMHGQINSWAIRFCYHQYKYDYLDVSPVISKVMNIGFTQDGTNCKYESTRFKTILDISDKRSFVFSDELIVDKNVRKEFYKHYSLRLRLYDKILQILWKIKN